MSAFSKQPRDRAGQDAAERDVREVQRRGGPFVAAVEATRMPMAVTDPTVADNPIVYANAAFLEMCGYDRDEVLGQNYLFLLGERADPAVAGRLAAAVTTRRRVEEVPFRAKDGREVWASMFVSPVVADGRVVQHFASFLDITDRVRREADLREAKAALDRRVATRTRRLQQANARLEAEVERRRRTEALLRDALAQGQEDLRYRDFLVREVNHRTKNALQLAASLLGVQARHVADPACRAVLETAMARLRRVGEVHALLTYRGDGPDAIDFPDYLRRLCREMAEGLAVEPGRVAVEVEAEAAEEAVWSGPRGAARPDRWRGADQRAQARLRRRARGPGPGRAARRRGGRRPDAAQRRGRRAGMPAAARREGSLGLRLIETLAKQVKGRAAVGSGPGGAGTVVAVTFPAPDGGSG